MEKVFSISVEGNEIRANEKYVFVFKKDEYLIQKIDLITQEISKLHSKFAISNIFVENVQFLVFSKKKIEIFCIHNFEKKEILNISNAKMLFKLPINKFLYIRDDKLFLKKGSKPIFNKKIINFQLIDRFLLVESKKEMEIYENNVGLVYSKSLNDLKNDFLSNVNLSCPTSIREGKVYFLIENKIVGPDLNVYLNDLKTQLSDKISNKDKLNSQNKAIVKQKVNFQLNDGNNEEILNNIDTYDSRYTKFTNIEGHLILLDSVQNILLVPKNLSKVIFKTKAADYFYLNSSKILITINDSKIFVFRELLNKIAPFKLIEENVVYSEQEDEFDISNCDIKMFE